MILTKQQQVEINTLNYGNLNDSDISKVKSFILDLQEKCNINGINLMIVNKPGVPYVTENAIMVNGYFDEKSKTLACAAGKDISQWLTILIHESSHMDQYLEQIPEWLNNLDLFETDKWLVGDDNVDMDRINMEIKTAVQVELDCEKRTVDKIKKWSMDNIVDVEEYVQKANAYILFYLWMKDNRKWYEIGREPYNLPEIFKEMPKTFETNYSELSAELRMTLDKLKNKN
jgi:hypothetical protein